MGRRVAGAAPGARAAKKDVMRATRAWGCASPAAFFGACSVDTGTRVSSSDTATWSDHVGGV